MKLTINEPGTEAFYREVVCAALQYKKLRKNPSMRLGNMQRTTLIYCILCFALMIILSVLAYSGGVDLMTVVCFLLMAVCFFFSLVYYVAIRRSVRKYIDEFRTTTVTFDENGITLEKQDSTTITLAWSNIHFLRVFSESMCFISRDDPPITISVANRYKSEVLSYLKEKHSDVTIYE